MSRIETRVGIQQRILPAYRTPFFDLLAADCSGGLSIFAGDQLPGESVLPGMPNIAQYYHARNRRLPGNLAGLLWQTNILEWVRDWNPEVLICEANPRTRTTLAAVREIKRRNGKTIGWGLGAPEFSGVLSIFKALSEKKPCFNMMRSLPTPRPGRNNTPWLESQKRGSLPPVMQYLPALHILPQTVNQLPPLESCICSSLAGCRSVSGWTCSWMPVHSCPMPCSRGCG